ncbi:MAG: hypothetical protein JWN41_1199 [Thermoleophilia bacterium]|nr:hypothetical protein [Thermoleophilia bacterium]
MHQRNPAIIAIVALFALVAGGCGSGKSIPDVRKCLKDAKFTTQASTKNDKDVSQGVSGILSNKDKPNELAIALAAKVKKTKNVKKFQTQVDALTKQLKAQDKKKYTFKNGVDGKYVWVVAGVKKSKAYESGLDCVQP